MRMHTQRALEKEWEMEIKKTENDVCERAKKISERKTLVIFCVWQNDDEKLFNIQHFCLLSLPRAHTLCEMNSFEQCVCVFSLLSHAFIYIRCKTRCTNVCTIMCVCVWNKLKCNCLNWKWRPKFEYFHSDSVEWQHKRKEIMLLTKWKKKHSNYSFLSPFVCVTKTDGFFFIFVGLLLLPLRNCCFMSVGLWSHLANYDCISHAFSVKPTQLLSSLSPFYHFIAFHIE